MDENKKDKKEIKNKKTQEEQIEEAKKDMEELMKSISEEVGGNNVKVVQLQVPRATFKNFLFTLGLSLLLNVLIFVGTSGFFEYVKYESILNLILFSVYFSLVERILEFVFLKFFTPLVIRTMGIAHLIPIVLTLLLVLLFPIFVTIPEIFIALVTLVFMHVCKGTIIKAIQNKIVLKKIRSKQNERKNNN